MPRKRTQPGERRIETSQKGRVSWRPGEKHPLDALQEDVDHLRQQIPLQLQQLRDSAEQTLHQLQAFLDATQNTEESEIFFSAADRAAHHEVVERFHNRKHFYHLQLVFTRQRYRRLLGKMQAIQAALDLAHSLVEDEASLLTTRAENEEAKQDSQETPEAEEQPHMTKEELRVQGIEEPLTNMIGSVKQSRQLLRDFEAKLPDLRRQLASGQGWFEVFYVPKRHFKKEIVAFAYALANREETKRPVPREIEEALHPEVARLIRAGVSQFPAELRLEVYDITEVGPYVKYRWTEDKHTYTISLGLEDDYPPFPFVPEGF